MAAGHRHCAAACLVVLVSDIARWQRNDAMRREVDRVRAARADALELAELRRFADLSVDAWLDMTGGTYPAPGDEWSHECWNRAKASGRLPIEERDIEWDGT
jgi:hypothetical protein